MSSYSWVRDACYGDSGGPIMKMRVDARLALAGVVSWGIGCGRPGYPGVYTNLSHYVEWVCGQVPDADCADQELQGRRAKQEWNFNFSALALDPRASQAPLEEAPRDAGFPRLRATAPTPRIVNGSPFESLASDYSIRERTVADSILGGGRIVNGAESVHTESGVLVTSETMPFYATLADMRGNMFCGGAVISPHVVITAAHCVKGYLRKVFLGKRVRSNECAAPDCRVYTIDAYIKHPEYNGALRLHNDIALLRIVEPIDSASVVAFAARSRGPELESYVIAGFGSISEDGGYATDLRIATVPPVDAVACRESPIGTFLHDGMMCAGMLWPPPPHAPPPSPPTPLHPPPRAPPPNPPPTPLHPPPCAPPPSPPTPLHPPPRTPPPSPRAPLHPPPRAPPRRAFATATSESLDNETFAPSLPPPEATKQERDTDEETQTDYYVYVTTTIPLFFVAMLVCAYVGVGLMPARASPYGTLKPQ
jgi:hypothetical protein